MATHAFDSAQIVIEGRPLRAMRINCAKCSKTDVSRMNSLRFGHGDDSQKEERIVARKFNEMGWSVDLKRKRHLCPECSMHLPPKEPEKMETVVQMPRQMTRDDRRIIFEKLNEVYVDEKQGYSAPWTDEQVSKDLGVPRAWVSNVREEMFGPVGSNSEIDALLKAANELIAEGVKLKLEASRISGQIESMQKQLDKITRAVRP